MASGQRNSLAATVPPPRPVSPGSPSARSPIAQKRASKVGLVGLPSRPSPAADVPVSGRLLQWHRELKDDFSEELMGLIHEAWIKADADGNNRLSRDEMHQFLSDLYRMTGLPPPPVAQLRADIVDMFRQYDLDRSNTIEIPEISHYLKRSGWRRQLGDNARWRAGSATPSSARGKLAPLGDGVPAQTQAEGAAPLPPLGQAGGGSPKAGSPAAAMRERRQTTRRPWEDSEEEGICEATVPVLSVAQRRHTAAAAAALPGRWSLPPDTPAPWATADLALERMKELAAAWEQKQGSVLDELAENLVAADGPAAAKGPCYAQLRELADVLHARNTAGDPDARLQCSVVALVVLALLGAPPHYADALLGFPPQAKAAAGRRHSADEASAMQADPADADESAPAHNASLWGEVCEACTNGGAALLKWAKTIALLCAVAEPLPDRLDGQEWRLARLSEEQRAGVKAAGLTATPASFCVPVLLEPCAAEGAKHGREARESLPASPKPVLCTALRIAPYVASPQGPQRSPRGHDAEHSPPLRSSQSFRKSLIVEPPVTVVEAAIRTGVFVGASHAVVPPLAILVVHKNAGKADTTASAAVGWLAGDSDCDRLRKRALDDARFADSQLELVGAISHEKRLQVYDAVFKLVFDTTDAGKLTADDIARGMRHFGEPLGVEECQALLQDGDTDGDGLLSFDEFAHALLRPPPPPPSAKRPQGSPRGQSGSPRRGQTSAQGRRRTAGDALNSSGKKQRGVAQSRGGGGDGEADEPPDGKQECARLWAHVQTAAATALKRVSASSRAARPSRYVPQMGREGSPRRRDTGAARERKVSYFPTDLENGDVVDVSTGDHKVPSTAGGTTITAGFVTIRGPAEGPRARFVGSGKAEDKPLITISSKRLVLENVDIVNEGAGIGLAVRGGCVDLIGCRVTSQNGGVLCDAGASMLVSGCTVADSRSWGMCFRGDGGSATTGIVEGSTFSGNSDGGIVVERHASPWISKCQFTQGKGCGVVFVRGGGTLVDSEVSENVCAGVWIEHGADPVIYRCKIHSGGASGIKVENEGKGLVENNELWGHANHEVEVLKQGCPVVRQNLLRNGASSGVYVSNGGRGRFEENDMRSFPISCVTIGPAGAPSVAGNVMWYDEKDSPDGQAVAVRQGARGTVCGNLFVGWCSKDHPAGPVQAGGEGSPRRRSTKTGGADPKAVPLPLGVTGSHDVVSQDNWCALTLDEARALRRQMLLTRFPPPRWAPAAAE
eukprot:TRINITY_DN879_c0_g1_i1.p1 TRINITY_DN879_c0_g1~~TRINITY_DN879_c0_g1_i1.p1  ORF type:complete len:1243 (+),score=385.19 TRINITY_DN879_c0_g1_i1:87-3815(+)